MFQTLQVLERAMLHTRYVNDFSLAGDAWCRPNTRAAHAPAPTELIVPP